MKTLLSIPAKMLGFERLLHFSGRKLFLPFYHVVSDDSLAHISPLYRHKNVSEFEADLDFLLQHFVPISLEEVNLVSKGEKKLSKPSFHLTFDDGLREVFSVVFPILKRKGIPATLFVNPSFVGNKALFFRYKAALLLDKYKKDGIRNMNNNSFNMDYIRAIGYHKRAELDQLAGTLNVDFQDFLDKTKPYLDLNELKMLSENGIEIGAHSLDHPLYSLISEEEQLRQTTESMAWVRLHFHPKVAAFAFPFSDDGVRTSFFERLNKTEHAPDLIFGTAGMNQEVRANHLQRIAMENGQYSAEQIVRNALMTNQLKKILGKNFIVR